jgi:hypothetical protein
MSTFKDYLTESAKSYDYKIKIAGDIDRKEFATKMETALGKFEVAKMSAGKKTPIQSLPLDFPQLNNESVTIFDVTTNYPASSREMQEYVATYMNLPLTHLVVRKPNEPSEEYQEEMATAEKSEYKCKLQDIEMSDAPKVDAKEFHSHEANMSLLKELLKDREAEPHKIDGGKAADDIKGITTKEDEQADSPLTKSTNPHPDPKRK